MSESETYWLPDSESDHSSRDKAIEWLLKAGGAGVSVIVVNAKNGATGQQAKRAAPNAFLTSPGARHRIPPGQVSAVLALWPSRDALEFAALVAHRAPLCVLPSERWDCSGWLAARSAINILGGPPPPVRCSPEVLDEISAVVEFDGHNDFLGAGGKQDAVLTLRQLAAIDPRPAPDEIEQGAQLAGTTPTGAKRLHDWYEELQGGTQHRGPGGRVIR